MSRFLLGLFAAAESEHNAQCHSSGSDSIVRFASIDIMGAQLRSISEDFYEDSIEDWRGNASLGDEEVESEELGSSA